MPILAHACLLLTTEIDIEPYSHYITVQQSQAVLELKDFIQLRNPATVRAEMGFTAVRFGFM